MSTPPTRPPPIPRRHPSRPSMSTAVSSGSVSSMLGGGGSPSPELPPPLPASSSTQSSTPTGPSARSTHSDATTVRSGEESNNRGHGRRSSAAATAGSPPTSPNLSRQSMGIGAATVGLGPVLLDFKDWVKAGQSSAAREGGGGSTIVAGENSREAARSPRVERHEAYVRDSMASADRSSGHSKYSSHPSAEYDGSMRDSYMSGYSSTSNAAPSSSMYRSSLPSSQSISSLSIDSSRSPHQAGRRTSSRMSEREPFRASTTATPRRASQDLSRELSASRASQRMSLHSSPHDSPGGGGLESPGLYDRNRHQNSPLERRFSRRLNLQRDGITSEPVEEEEIETIQQSRDGAMSLDERIRDAEEKLARRASLRSEAGTPLRRLNSHRTTPSRTTVPSSPMTNGNTPYDSADNSTSEGRHGHARVRPSIPELQNGRMFTPSPSNGHRPGHLVDLNSSPSSPLRSQSRQEWDLSSPRSYRMVTSAAPRPQSVMDNRDSGSWNRPRAYSRGGDLENFASASPRRDFPARTRPESVLGTSAEYNRYNNGYTPQRQISQEQRSHRLSALLNNDRDYGSRSSYISSRASQDFGKRDSMYSRASRDFSNRDSADYSARSSRDFGGSRVGLSPNDSVSVVGAPRSEVVTPRKDSARKDPLEMIRRLEESRTQHNKRWEEDRSASVLGDSRSVSRYGEREIIVAPSRQEETPQPGRPSSRLSMMGPRSISSLSSVRDSYVASTPHTAPNARRRTDSNSSIAESPLHGRTSRASGSHAPSTEPRLQRRSQTSFGTRSHGSSDRMSTTDHGRNLVDAARILEKKGEVDPHIIAKLGTAASVSERSNAGIRAAVAIAQELVLDVELGEESAVRTVKDRLPRLAVTLREAGRASDQAVRDLTEALLAARGTSSTSTPARTQAATHRRGTTLGGNAHDSGHGTPRHSPSLSTSSVHSPLMRYRSQTPQSERPSSYRHDSTASTTSSKYDSAPRVLDPIEQSPPKPTSPRESPSLPTGPLGALGISSTDSRTRVHQEEHSLRKQSSLASTHTVRANSFQPSHPEATTAVSSSPAFSVPLSREFSRSSQESLKINTRMSPRHDERAVYVDEIDESEPNRQSVMSAGSEYSDSPVSPAAAPVLGSEMSRKGTFGAAAGSQIKASVSERFRAHLNGNGGAAGGGGE